MKILILLLLGSFVFAQETATDGASSASGKTNTVVSLTPDDAVKMAIENNLGLEQARLQNQARRRAAQTVWNSFIPTVDVSSTLGRFNKTQTYSGLAPVGPISSVNGIDIYGVTPFSQDLPQWFLQSSLQFGLNINIGTFVAMNQSIEEYEAGKISIEKAKLQLERDVRKAYYNMLLAKEQITLLNRSMDNANQQVAMAQANYRGGLIPEVSLLQVQVARENLRPQIDQAQNMYRAAMASFAMFLGQPYETEFDLVSVPGDVEFIVLETQDLISRAAANKPEIAELRRNLAALKAQRTSVFYNLYTPTVSLGFNMDPTFMRDPTKDNWFNFNYWKQQQGMFRITLAMRLNALLPFTKEAQAFMALNDGVKAMELGVNQAIQGTELEVYNIIMNLENIRTTAAAQASRVTLARRTLSLSSTAYRNGLRPFMDVQNDELALRQAELGMAQQNYNYLIGLLDLEYALGVPYGSLGK